MTGKCSGAFATSNFVSVHLMNFCEFRHLRVGQNLWILSFQCENDDCVYAGLVIGLQSMRQIVWCILIDVLLGPFHPAGVPFSVVIMDHYQASHWNIYIIPS
jgi:hypothetical protein